MKHHTARLVILGALSGWAAPQLSSCTTAEQRDTIDAGTSDADTSDLNPLDWPECIPAPAGPTEGPPCNNSEPSDNCYLASTPAWDQGAICMFEARASGGVLTDENVERYVNRNSNRPMLVLPCCDEEVVVWASWGPSEVSYAFVYDAETRRELGRVEFPYGDDYDPDLGDPPCWIGYSGDPALMPCLFNALHEVSSRHEACEDQGCECVVNGFTDAVPDDCE